VTPQPPGGRVWGRNASAGRFVAIIITTPTGRLLARSSREQSQLFLLEGEKQKTCNLRSKKGADFVCQKITD
jgi:hypothetical protein